MSGVPGHPLRARHRDRRRRRRRQRRGHRRGPRRRRHGLRHERAAPALPRRPLPGTRQDRGIQPVRPRPRGRRLRPRHRLGADPRREGAEARHERHGLAHAARQRAGRHRGRPGRMLRGHPPDDPRRPDLHGARQRLLLRREHARRRAEHVDVGADERDAPLHPPDRAARVEGRAASGCRARRRPEHPRAARWSTPGVATAHGLEPGAARGRARPDARRARASGDGRVAGGSPRPVRCRRRSTGRTPRGPRARAPGSRG